MARMSVPPGFRLPPGFRFHPTDVELIMYHLKRKIMGKKFGIEAISELNIYKFSPWDLPDKSCLNSKDLEWYFFCPRERKYASGNRMKRGTDTGYWKTTGKDRSILYDGRVVGMVKTLVFHEGNAPEGKRTDWVVHEYRMDDQKLVDAGVPQDGYVLYKLFKKNGLGPKNGAQYGAPFNEKEWEDNDDDSVIAIDPLPCGGPSSSVIAAPENQNPAALKSLSASGLSVVGGGPSVQPSSSRVLVDGPNDSMVTDMSDPRSPSGWPTNGQGLSSVWPAVCDIIPSPEDIAHLLARFTEDGTPLPNEENVELGEPGPCEENADPLCLEGYDLFNGLEDLNTGAELSGQINFSHEGHHMNYILPQDDMGYLELNDLDMPLNFSVDSGGFEKVPTGSSYAACNAGASEHVLNGNLNTQYGFGADLGQVCYNGNFPSLDPKSSQFSVGPDSSTRPVDSTNILPTANNYGNFLSQGYTAGCDLHSFPCRQAEESVDATGNQERASDEVA